MTAATSKKVLTKEQWQAKLDSVKISKADLNKLIMNYFMIEGFKDAAQKFAKEANLSHADFDVNSINNRMEIRNALQAGYVDLAIQKVNDLDPEILDTNPKLFFHLQQQKLIELIRIGDISEAIRFAQEELAPRGEENPEFLEELEKTMALLVFDHSKAGSLGSLLDHSQRQKTASELNAAILTAQCQEKDPKLPSLLKMLVWAQTQLDEKMVYPKIKNLSTAKLEDPSTTTTN